MTALLVILTILFFLGVDALHLYIKKVRTERTLAKDPGAFFDPVNGWCMCDGGEPIKKDEEST